MGHPADLYHYVTLQLWREGVECLFTLLFARTSGFHYRCRIVFNIYLLKLLDDNKWYHYICREINSIYTDLKNYSFSAVDLFVCGCRNRVSNGYRQIVTRSTRHWQILEERSDNRCVLIYNHLMRNLTLT